MKPVQDWQPREGCTIIRTVDAHTAGEPLRVIMAGFPELPGTSMLERRRFAKEELDHLRTALMWEPRGHADMYGAIITPAVSDDADFGVLFLHNEGFSTMCGHGIIAVTKVVLETGRLPITSPETKVTIDTPAGCVVAFARIQEDAVTGVRFHNVPSFVVALDETVVVPDWGAVHYDLAFGGAFYAFVDAAALNLTCRPEATDQLIAAGRAVKQAVMAARSIEHPAEPELGFLYGTIFIDRAADPGADSRNVCIFAAGEVDRSPTGTGVSARMAIHFARGEIGLGDQMTIESIIGSRMIGRVVRATAVGPHAAVIPEVAGTSHITGRHEFFIAPDDPLRHGFILR